MHIDETHETAGLTAHQGRVIPRFPIGHSREKLFWLLQFAGWGVVGIISLSPLLQIFTFQAVAWILTLRLASGLLVTWGMRSIYRRIQWREYSSWKFGAGILAFCILLGLADSFSTHFLAIYILEILGIGEQATPDIQMFVLLMGALLRSAILVIWSLLYFGIKLWLDNHEAKLKTAQSEAAVRTSELKRLRAQVNPHFLFNALNSILAEKNNPMAVEKITMELSEYLRFMLRPSGDLQVLGDEMDALENYLCVEKARFEEKLHYTLDVCPQARKAHVPVALIQPLLENAMKYGRATSPLPLRISVTAKLSDKGDVLHATVANTGRWVEFDEQRSHGIGLTNLRSRLELLFSHEATLSHQVDNGWVRVSAQIPVTTYNN